MKKEELIIRFLDFLHKIDNDNIEDITSNFLRAIRWCLISQKIEEKGGEEISKINNKKLSALDNLIDWLSDIEKYIESERKIK